MVQPARAGAPAPIATPCPYCALQCGMRLAGPPEAATVQGNEAFPVNAGALCVKGWTAADLLRHPDRLLRPLARNRRGALVPVDWDAALDRTARALKSIQQ